MVSPSFLNQIMLDTFLCNLLQHSWATIERESDPIGECLLEGHVPVQGASDIKSRSAFCICSQVTSTKSNIGPSPALSLIHTMFWAHTSKSQIGTAIDNLKFGQPFQTMWWDRVVRLFHTRCSSSSRPFSLSVCRFVSLISTSLDQRS